MKHDATNNLGALPAHLLACEAGHLPTGLSPDHNDQGRPACANHALPDVTVHSTFSRIATVSMILSLALSPAAAAPPFEMTQVFDIGGGGCVGETRVYDDATLAKSDYKLPTAQAGKAKDAAWQSIERTLASKPRYFLTTVGCGADRVAISINGKAYLLETSRIEEIGMPVTYYADAQASPSVRIERLALLHAIRFKDTECTQSFQRVSVQVQFQNAKSTVSGLAIGSCP